VDEQIHDIGTELNDEQLMIAVQKGDKTAYEALVLRYRDDALRLAYHYLHNWEDARDISQDAFVKVYLKADSFDPAQRFRPWFFRILVNHSLNFLNRKKKVKFLSIFQRSRENEEAILLDQLSDDEGIGHEFQSRQMVWKALAALSGSHRDVLILHEMQGFKEQEISEMLGCSVGTVKSRLHYAKKRMRRLLSEELK
jgi:RNA polymerase sigma-70 factor (ECF subfamily)